MILGPYFNEKRGPKTVKIRGPKWLKKTPKNPLFTPFFTPSKSVLMPRGVYVILAPAFGLAKFYEPTGMGSSRVYLRLSWLF